MSVHRCCSLLLLVALTTLAACSETPAPAQARSGPPTPSEVEISSVIVSPEVLIRRISALGTLQADETALVSAEISGRITEIKFAEGEHVEKGQSLFQLDDRIDRAELGRVEAQLALAKRNHERARELSDRRLLSPAEVDQTLSALRVAEAEVAVARTRVEKTQVPAPFSGLIGLRLVSPGSYVSPGQPLVNLEAIDRIKLDFRVPEAQLSQLSIGQTAQVTLDALPEEAFEAAVVAINPRASAASRSIEVRAHIDNSGGRLRPGLFARVQLELGRKDDALMLPEAAVFPRGEKNFVYRIDENNRAELVEVILGQREPGSVEIRKGLAAMDEVITGGIQRLSDGSPIRRQADVAGR